MTQRISPEHNQKKKINPAIKLREIELRIHIHATESVDKIKQGLNFLLPPDLEHFEPDELNLTHVMSIFHTPIRILTVSIKKQPRIRKFISYLADLMPDDVKEALSRDFERRLNERKQFFFRIDKQALLMNKIKLAAGSDIVQVVLSPINKNPKSPFEIEDIRNFFKQLRII